MFQDASIEETEHNKEEATIVASFPQHVHQQEADIDKLHDFFMTNQQNDSMRLSKH